LLTAIFAREKAARGKKQDFILLKYRSTEKYREVQRSTEKYNEVQRSTEKYERSTILFSHFFLKNRAKVFCY
jgi:hypothetical protein